LISTPGLTGVGTGWQAPGWRTGRGTATDPWAVADIAAPAAGIGIGAAGELTVAGLEWLGARVYDPASRGFLSADPLDPVPGAGWSGNPYAFAGNDPLHALDPTGLRPVTDAELKAYAASNNGALSAAGDWLGDNWEYVAGGAMVVAGGVLMATGVGGPAGVALLSAGADTIIQKATTGEVNWGEVAVSGVLGGVGGGAASWAARASTNGVRALATRAAVYGGVGAVGSEAGYVTKNHDKLSWRGALGAGVGGFFGGAVGAAGGPASGTLARALGRSTTSLTAKGIGAGLSFATGSSASVVNNLVSGQPINWTGAAISGGMGAGGSFIPPVVKSNGTSTLSQLSYFGPRTVSGVFNVGATNTGALWASTAQGAVTGYAAGMTIPPLLGQP
jgi:RHS repeat-associated protein